MCKKDESICQLEDGTRSNKAAIVSSQTTAEYVLQLLAVTALVVILAIEDVLFLPFIGMLENSKIPMTDTGI